jgi:ketosteroid isomerase-like protein
MLETLRFRLRLETIHPGLDPDLLVAEYTSDGIAKPTGKPYRNVYIGLYRFRDGRLCGLREFYNPVPALESLSVD